MSQIDLEVDTSVFDRRWPNFTRLLTNLPGYLVEDTAGIVEQEMKIAIPKGGTGRLENSVESHINGNQATVTTNTGYGMAVDKGRRGLDIYPVNGRALRFFYNGRMIFAKESHPGPSKPSNFKQTTILIAGKRAFEQMQDRVKREMASI